jgi:hypothetical protein
MNLRRNHYRRLTHKPRIKTMSTERPLPRRDLPIQSCRNHQPNLQLAPFPQLLPNLDEGLHLPRAGHPAVDQATTPIGLFVRIANPSHAEVCEVASQVLQVLLGQDVRFLAIRTARHG